MFKGHFVRGVGFIAGGTALGQAVVLIASPVITRLYCPEDFGIFSVYASLLGLLTVFGSMRYAFAIPLPKDADTAANLLALSLLVIFFVTFIISLFIWKAGDHIVLLLKIPKLRPYLWLLPVGVFGASTYSAFNFWAIRENNYKKIG
ncbi:MAG: oligosaccharide flippase family protein, partial [Deltaproteobacteria bacterium]|nr:oligosaccharide flippase family protein [Deltaproteobacteria bacterium]